MPHPNILLAKIEEHRLWAYFHKDWLLEIRRLLRPQVPPTYSVFVESETILLSPESQEPLSPSMPDLAVARSVADTGINQSHTTTTTAAVIELEEPYEIASRYSLLIRRSPDQQIVAALEILSPSNKGVGSRLDCEKYLHKRDSYTEAGISFLEIDALTSGNRILPDSLRRLASFGRNAWTSFHHDGVRRLQGYGWNSEDRLPVMPWQIEGDLRLIVDLHATAAAALEFNPWESLVADSK
jgi:uncharacterized protein DUF4058